MFSRNRLSVAALLLLVAPCVAQTPLTSVEIASGLGDATDIASAPGDESRLWVTRRPGTIHLVKDGTLQTTPFLDIGPNGTDKVEFAFVERGLLGLAFHPNYVNNGYFYVNYTRKPDGWTVIERYSVSATNPDVADPTSGFTILTQQQPNQNHNGGCIKFGPDGYLYIAFGESLGLCVATNGNSFLGKILRIDVDGGSPYAVPPTNPFVGSPGVRDEIFLMGLRNPWRMSFDSATGDLYIGDVGWTTREEINVWQPGKPGRHYGWPVYEGTFCHGAMFCGNCSSVFVQPVFEYNYLGAGSLCSVIGGAVYRGCAIPDLRGTYFYGDHCGGTFSIMSFRLASGMATAWQNRTSELSVPSALRLTTFGEDARGEIYYTGRAGRLFKIVAAAPAPAVSLGYAKAGANGLIPNLDMCGLLNTGNSAEMRLTSAAPSAPGALWVGLNSNPFPFQGGTIVPVPPVAQIPIATDPQGVLQFNVKGGGGPIDLYAQYIILDAGASNGFSLSNAIKITVQP